MSDEIKVLGQAKPAAGVLMDLYTVPDLAQTTVSTFLACSQDTGNDAIRASVAVNGAADSLEQYILYDFDLGSHITEYLTIGMTLGPGDVIRVYSAKGNISFNIFGVETT